MTANYCIYLASIHVNEVAMSFNSQVWFYGTEFYEKSGKGLEVDLLKSVEPSMQENSSLLGNI